MSYKAAGGAIDGDAIVAEPHVQPLEVGIFARTFPAEDLASVLSAARSFGFRSLHFNFRSAGMPSLPPEIDEATCVEIARTFDRYQMRMLGVSATYNPIHPDRKRRQTETGLACRIIGLAPMLGTNFVSLSTGTRDPGDMWHAHPDNDDPSAWADLLESLKILLSSADESGVLLGIEPETSNVVSSSSKALQLVRELANPRLRIILDPANIIDPSVPQSQSETLTEAFTLLSPYVSMLHAKDVTTRGHVAAGRGVLDYDLIFGLVERHHIACPVVIHDVEPHDVRRTYAFVEKFASRARSALVTE